MSLLTTAIAHGLTSGDLDLESDLRDSGEAGSEAGSEAKKKKVRTTFTGRQIFELEKMFETKKYLSSSERAEMSKVLSVTEQQVIFVLKAFTSKGFFLDCDEGISFSLLLLPLSKLLGPSRLLYLMTPIGTSNLHS